MLCSATYRYNDHHFLDAVPKIPVKFSDGYFSDTLLVSRQSTRPLPYYGLSGCPVAQKVGFDLLGAVELLKASSEIFAA